MNPARPTIEVAAGLVFRDGKLLITQRPPDSHLGGLWEFPGGKREPGESYEDCLRRELGEELGIEIVVGELVESVTHDYPEKTVTLQFFHCVWKSSEPQALGCPDFRWVSPEELTGYEFPEADLKLVELLKGRTDFW
ncbi:MAG: 8-oxo-dGTP diphosphatase MutT, partial [Verrucomicrobia subdivision 3 bacterium]|nr:8-oxo-dGTP diphosphatase MutT [Limisphaerales bacterium]